MNENLVDWRRKRENGESSKKPYGKWNQDLINRLGVTGELHGHRGCVNVIKGDWVEVPLKKPFQVNYWKYRFL